jgi:nucleoside-diphosphate-sugar epimerase
MRRESFDAAIDMLAFTAEDAMASLAAFRGVSHYIHISSVRVYGTDFSWLPISEDHPLRPTVPYGRGKVDAERTFLGAHYRDGFPATIVRLSTTYGPRWIVRQLCLDTSWIDRILTDRPIAILGDGRAVHHFLHVDDAARAFVGLLGRGEAFGKAYNVVNPQPTTWFAYHQTAIDVLGADVEQVSVPVKAVFALDPRRFELADGVFSHNLLYDSTRLLREIPDWRPCISLEEGLRTSFEYVAEKGMIEASLPGGWEDQLIARFRYSPSSPA